MAVPLVEACKPLALDDIVFHRGVVETLRSFITSGETDVPQMIFHGPPGSGKTATIGAFLREFYGEDYDIMTMNINASEERGIDTVREKIRQFIKHKPIGGTARGKPKFVVLDEAGAMTIEAQSILKRMIEANSANSRFCLLVNSLYRLDPAIKSRCSVFRFPPIPTSVMVPVARKMLKDTAPLPRIVEVCMDSRGDMRKMVNGVQLLSHGAPPRSGLNAAKRAYTRMLDDVPVTEAVKVATSCCPDLSVVRLITTLADFLASDMINFSIDIAKAIRVADGLASVELDALAGGDSWAQRAAIGAAFCS